MGCLFFDAVGDSRLSNYGKMDFVDWDYLFSQAIILGF